VKACVKITLNDNVSILNNETSIVILKVIKRAQQSHLSYRSTELNVNTILSIKC